ncbi:MAG: chorismate mutase [Chloroflexota bacterium]
MTATQPARPARCRGVRGAISVEANTAEAIVSAARELLEAIVAANGIDAEDVCSLLLTVTPDLTAEYPAVAARQIGWDAVAVMCAQEMAVPHGLARCVRALVHWNTDRAAEEIRHVYLRDAELLRPDRVARPAL